MLEQNKRWFYIRDLMLRKLEATRNVEGYGNLAFK
jgi:hypothetical protein